ncbi:hypothetical protein, partial [Desulfobulbus propionicus]
MAILASLAILSSRLLDEAAERQNKNQCILAQESDFQTLTARSILWKKPKENGSKPSTSVT